MVCPSIQPFVYNVRNYVYGLSSTVASYAPGVATSTTTAGGYYYIMMFARRAKNPSNFVLLGDSSVYYPTGYAPYEIVPGFAQCFELTTTVKDNAAHMRHGGFGNFAFLDGHSAALGGADYATKMKIRAGNSTLVYYLDQKFNYIQR